MTFNSKKLTNDGRVFSKKFYKSHGGNVVTFPNPTRSREVSIQKNAKIAEINAKIFKAQTGVYPLTTIPDHCVGKEVAQILREKGIPVELVSVKKYKKMFKR